MDEPIVGQERAVKSIEFGLDISLKGYNIYVMGYPGHGMHTLTKKMVIPKSRLLSKASDWCYVYNFDNPLQPKVLKLAPGAGKRFKADIDDLIEQLHDAFSVKAAVDTIRDLRIKYQDNLSVVKHLNALLKDIRAHEDEFFTKPNHTVVLFDQPHLEVPPFSRLKVNLFVDNSKTIGRPVIFQAIHQCIR